MSIFSLIKRHYNYKRTCPAQYMQCEWRACVHAHAHVRVRMCMHMCARAWHGRGARVRARSCQWMSIAIWDWRGKCKPRGRCFVLVAMVCAAAGGLNAKPRDIGTRGPWWWQTELELAIASDRHPSRHQTRQQAAGAGRCFAHAGQALM